MTSPYTTEPLEALMAAQTAVGLVLGAVLWWRSLRPWLATWLLWMAIGIAVVAPLSGSLLAGLGVRVAADHTLQALRLAAAMATLAALLTRRGPLVALALLGEGALFWLTRFIVDSEPELAATHLAFFGLLVGVHLRTLPLEPSLAPSTQAPPWPGEWADDVAAFLLGTVAGGVVCRLLLHGWTNSGDEWANTFEAALFAKLRAYGTVPRCSESFHSFWVFQYMGRSFAQYTPGWPLFMAPFVSLHLAWLAGPASLGVLSAAVCRLGRRAVAGYSPRADPPSRSVVRAGGWFAVLALLLGAAVLMNGGSRYPHVFVAGMFAWSAEALFCVTSEKLAPAWQWRWGAVLGASAALLLAARPGDGATLGFGVFLYFAYALVRGRLGMRSIAAAALAFALLGGLALVILRLQLGRWFTTGYSLTTTIYPWVDFKWGKPTPGEYKWGIPLATGAYCWWPCSPAVGFAGLASLRGRAQRMGFVFCFSVLPFLALYSYLGMSRGFDMGYGPRYTLPCVVPMAVGSGVVLARLWRAGCARWSPSAAVQVGGPAAIALTMAALAVVRIAPLLYLPAYAEVQNHNRLHAALEPLHLRNAVVFAGAGLNNTDPADLTENLPLELYGDQDVLIALDRGAEGDRCVREQYPQRKAYRALPGSPVKITPL